MAATLSPENNLEETKNSKNPESTDDNNEKSSVTPEKLIKSNVEEIAIDASEIVSRLEQAIEGTPPDSSAGTYYENTRRPSTLLLGLEKKNTNDIISTIDGLITVDENGDPVQPLAYDSVTKLVMVSHSLAAYCGGLDRAILRKLSTRFTTDSTRWISQLFGFLDCSAYYHEDHVDGLLRITKMNLYFKYPKYLEDGALAFASSPPTIYTSVSSPLIIAQYICRQLGLPLSSIRPVPSIQYTMDIEKLQQMLVEDQEAGLTPLIVIADVGTLITGHVDDVATIRNICRIFDCWLHIRGHNLAALTLPDHQHNLTISPVADSFTLTLGSWWGIPALPHVTLYKSWDITKNKQNNYSSRESTLPLLAGLNNDHQGRRIISLPLWAALQGMGKEGVLSKIRENFLASERLYTALNAFRHIRILSPKPGGESGAYTITELISKPVADVAMLLRSTACCVTFQFIPELEPDAIKVLTKVPPYYNRLNTWLGQVLEVEAPQIPIDTCQLENIGIVLRFCPFEISLSQQPTIDEFKAFIQCLEQQLIVLRSTIYHKKTFKELVESSSVLKLIDLPNWAGMGCVRYCPEGWDEILNDQMKEELNKLNIALVDAIRSTDAAFSIGETEDGLVCVRFGMIGSQSDVEKLLALVIRVGQSIEENCRVLDSMSEIVKKGIETATKDLQKENEERLWQEGIMRHVPIVGNIVNWWSPKTKESGVRGRSLNLTQGVVESTENIYKYHMQIQTGSVATAGSKNPPTPQIQTPISVSSHSRSSSHASGSSQIVVKDNEKNNLPKLETVK